MTLHITNGNHLLLNTSYYINKVSDMYYHKVSAVLISTTIIRIKL